jgi:hypothetical protein
LKRVEMYLKNPLRLQCLLLRQSAGNAFTFGTDGKEEAILVAIAIIFSLARFSIEKGGSSIYFESVIGIGSSDVPPVRVGAERTVVARRAKARRITVWKLNSMFVKSIAEFKECFC